MLRILNKHILFFCLDNRNRPLPQGIQRNKIEMQRNAPLKNKNTNQEKKLSNNQYDDYAEQLK